MDNSFYKHIFLAVSALCGIPQYFYWDWIYLMMKIVLSSLGCKIFRFNPFMSSRLFYLKSLDKFISYIGGVWVIFIFTKFCKNFWT